MEYFRSGLKSVLGAPQPGDQPTVPETVSNPRFFNPAILIHLFSKACLF